MSETEMLSIQAVARRIGESSGVQAILRNIDCAPVEVEIHEGRLLRCDLATELLLEGARARACRPAVKPAEEFSAEQDDAFRTLVRQWQAIYGSDRITIKDLLVLAPDFPSPANSSRGLASALGQYVSRQVGRQVHGVTIYRLGVHHNAAVYQLMPEASHD